MTAPRLNRTHGRKCQIRTRIWQKYYERLFELWNEFEWTEYLWLQTTGKKINKPHSKTWKKQCFLKPIECIVRNRISLFEIQLDTITLNRILWQTKRRVHQLIECATQIPKLLMKLFATSRWFYIFVLFCSFLPFVKYLYKRFFEKKIFVRLDNISQSVDGKHEKVINLNLFYFQTQNSKSHCQLTVFLENQHWFWQ